MNKKLKLLKEYLQYEDPEYYEQIKDKVLPDEIWVNWATG